MTALWIPHRKRRFEEAIRHLPIEERGKFWVLYHKGAADETFEETLFRVCEEPLRRLGELLTPLGPPDGWLGLRMR